MSGGFFNNCKWFNGDKKEDKKEESPANSFDENISVSESSGGVKLKEKLKEQSQKFKEGDKTKSSNMKEYAVCMNGCRKECKDKIKHDKI